MLHFLYLFIFMYCLFNDDLSSSDCTESNGMIIVNNALERMKQEVVVACSRQSLHLLGGRGISRNMSEQLERGTSSIRSRIAIHLLSTFRKFYARKFKTSEILTTYKTLAETYMILINPLKNYNLFCIHTFSLYLRVNFHWEAQVNIRCLVQE